MQYLRSKAKADDRTFKFKALQDIFDKTTDIYVAIHWPVLKKT